MALQVFPASNATVLVALATATIALACVGFVVYQVYLSPLSRVPAAHPLAQISSLWIQWHRWRGTEFDRITSALATKGPYVRVGPNEIVLNAIDAVRSVYGVGANNFDRHPSYDYFITQGTRNMFTSLGKNHRSKRRRISSIYSRSFLQTSPHARAVMHSLLVERMLPVLTRTSATAHSSINVLPLFQSFALDFMSTFAFGISRGFNFIRDEEARWRWIDQFNMSYPPGSGFWMREYPMLVKWLPHFGVPIVPKGHFEARKACEAWAIAKVEECEEAFQRAGGDLQSASSFAPGEFPVLYAYVREGLAKTAGTEKAFHPGHAEVLELASECFDHMAATGDTFGTMFTYMIYEISRHEAIQHELRQELLSIEVPFMYDESSTSAISIPSPKSLETLPFLDCVIQESLRLRNNAPNLDPRLTPSQGESKVGELSNLPPGVRIGTYGWWLNRNPDVYPNPESWEPRRWQSGGPEAAAQRHAWLFAFGGGSRGCIGQQAAMELMRLLLCGIYTNFRTTVADESGYPGANKFVGSDCSERLFIKFEKLSKE